jgi:adenylate cyclase
MDESTDFKIDKLDETVIAGSIVRSTIDQLGLLGVVGEEILADMDVSQFQPDGKYHRSIRGKIHQTIKARFGQDALFYLGFEQFNKKSMENIFGSWMLDELEKLKKEKKKLASINSIDDERLLQNHVLKMITKFHTLGGKAAIFSKNDHAFASYDEINSDEYVVHIKNAVYKGHHEFNRGSLMKLLYLFLGDRWHICIQSIEDKFTYYPGLTSNYFKLVFSYKKKKEVISNVVKLLQSEAKDKFLKSVINSAERERKTAIDQGEKLKIISQKIAKYIPPQIYEAFSNGNYDDEITTRRKKLTIFFSDIKNFTHISESLQPEDLTKYLNEYFSEMTKIAIDQGATIDKYIGDAIMLFFGDPSSQGERKDARACVEMALLMQERMLHLRQKWLNEGFGEPFQVRMGINTGFCNVGNFGSDQRLTYTIIGGEVNVAQRLEASADANGILMSYESYAHAQDMVEVDERERITMKGISREIKVFSVVGRKNEKKSKKYETKKEVTKKELSQIDKLEKDLNHLKNDMQTINQKIDTLLKKPEERFKR